MELPQFLPEWNIIPAIRNEKRPISNWTKYQNMKCPRTELDNYNNSNFLAICGSTSDNLFAIDFDFKKSLNSDEVRNGFYQIAEELQEALGDIVNTRVHKTPHGFHLIFECEKIVETKRYTNIYRKKKKKLIFTGVVTTKYQKLLSGLDIQGEGALIMIPPSEVNEKAYMVLNEEAGIKRLTVEECKKLISFLVLKKPKKMRSKFIDIVNGKVEIHQVSAAMGQKELVYWKWLFIEAYQKCGIEAEELYPFLLLNQSSFNQAVTEKQLSYDYHDYKNPTNSKLLKPLTKRTYNKYFYESYKDDDLDQEFTDSIKELEKRKKAKSVDDPDKKSVKELTDYLVNQIKNNYDIVTLDDSRQIMIKENNHYSFKTNDMYLFMKEIIDTFSKGSYKTYKANAEEIIRDSTLVERKFFCTDSHIINFKNGVYDLLKNKFYKEYDRAFFYCIPHDYIEESHECPKFEAALDQWLIPSDKSNIIIHDDIYEGFGLCLSTHTGFKKAFMNFGKTNSGKTQLTNIIRHIVGDDNTSELTLQRITADHFGTVGLQYKLLNIGGEIGAGIVKKPETFKTLTGDDKKVPCEIKGGRPFGFRNYAKFWFNANEFPEIKETKDIAFFERFIIIFFPNSFEMGDEDFVLQIHESICTPEETTAIIQKSIEGLKRLIQRKGFRPEIQKNTRHIWLYESDPIYKFLDDYCVLEKGATINKIEFYDLFIEYGEGFVAKNSFTTRLQKFGVISKQIRIADGRQYHYIGIRLKDNVNLEVNFDETKKLDTDGILNYVGK